MDTVFHYVNSSVAIVTGGTNGIGAAIVKMLAKCGFYVAIVGRNDARGNNIAEDLKDLGYDSRFFLCDITDDHACESLVSKIAKWNSKISVLVNCAGVLSATPIEEITRAEWDNVIATNLSGTFFMIQKVLPYLKISNHGRIINIASNAGRMGGYANSQSYTASKGGVIAITRGIARQLAHYGITVNVVCPGTTETEMVSRYSDVIKDDLKQRIPLHRLGTCEEIASVVCYLASIEAGYITGATIDVNGGLYMG